MSTQSTILGELRVGSAEDVYHAMADEIVKTIKAASRMPIIGLTGGSTPRGFYAWALRERPFEGSLLNCAIWTTSDERYVPLESGESNFGTAEREFLDVFGVAQEQRLPWPVHVDPHSASILFNRTWDERFGIYRGMDLCFLGMGGDGHTASIFPGSPIVGLQTRDQFSSVDVPEKGWRLTINSTGLSRCARICVVVSGTEKSQILKAVLEEDRDPGQFPVQMLREHAAKTCWFVDRKAAVLIAENDVAQCNNGTM